MGNAHWKFKYFEQLYKCNSESEPNTSAVIDSASSDWVITRPSELFLPSETKLRHHLDGLWLILTRSLMHCLKTDIVLYILTENLYIFTELVVWLEYLECDDENIDDGYNMMTLQSMMLVVCAYIDDDGEHQDDTEYDDDRDDRDDHGDDKIMMVMTLESVIKNGKVSGMQFYWW